jgi:hypothetical protein
MARNHATSRRGRVRQQVVVALSSAPWKRVRGHRAGAVVGGTPASPLVDYPGNPHGPIAARTIADLSGSVPARAAGDPPREALLVFEDERSDRPIVVGLLAPSAPAKPGKAVTAVVDGKQVVIDAQDEIVLRCGEASITLRRNGRVVIRGAYVETRSRGVNRIKGGSVQIN